MKVITFAVFVIAVLFTVSMIVALPVMLLWDWLMPQLFNLPEITWFQAWGLTFLCSLLFKSHNYPKT